MYQNSHCHCVISLYYRYSACLSHLYRLLQLALDLRKSQVNISCHQNSQLPFLWYTLTVVSCRDPGGQKRRNKDNFNISLKKFHIILDGAAIYIWDLWQAAKHTHTSTSNHQLHHKAKPRLQVCGSKIGLFVQVNIIRQEWSLIMVMIIGFKLLRR